MQITINSARGKNKAADLKKQIQTACLTHRSTKIQQIKQNQQKQSTIQQLKQLKLKPNLQSNKSSTLLQINNSTNNKKGLINSSSSGLIKNKQNQQYNTNNSKTNLGPSKKLSSSVVLIQGKSIKQKINNSKQHLKLTNSMEFNSNNLQNGKVQSNKTLITKQTKQKKQFPTNNLNSKQNYNENDQQHPVRLKLKNQIIQHLNPKFFQQEKKIISSNITLDDFQMGKKLGKGRFGNVYMAQHKQHKFTLAIKMINIKQLKESEMQSQLIQQIKLQMYMNHPNILKMYGFFSDQKNIYLLLELGNTCLFKQLRNKKYFSEQQTAYYIKQIIQSLKYLHNQSIIHRDIKPENILIAQGVLKLSDFGWSIYSPIHKRQTFCGTLDYVPPQIVQGDYYDQRVDIWSLGVLCYQLAVGKAPFQVPNDQQGTYDKILSVQLTFPAHLSLQLKDLISKILIKNPKKRLNLSEIEKHAWLSKYSTVGRYISKQIWQSWEQIR